MAAGQKAFSGARLLPVNGLTGPQLKEKSRCFTKGLRKMIHVSNMNLPQILAEFNRITDAQEKKNEENIQPF